MSSLLSTILKATGLEKIIHPLKELGVETPDDLILLDENAIQNLKLNYLQEENFKALIKERKEAVYGDDIDIEYTLDGRKTEEAKHGQQGIKRKQEGCNEPKRRKYNTQDLSHESNATSNKADSHDRQMFCSIIIQSQCKTVSRKGDLTIYQPRMKIVYVDTSTNFQKKEFGPPNQQYPEKVVLIVGATGSGKTTLINGIVNYLFSVKYNDPFRYKLMLDAEDGSGKQSESQTSCITAYTLYHQETFPLPFNLTIIDTPGFGDTRGIKRDLKVSEQIKNFFSTPGDKGIDHIDAVGFVAQSSLPRLTPTQQYIFDSILSLFGRDIEENIFLLLTFADGRRPQALAAISEFNIPNQCWFKFNNSALFSEVDKTCPGVTSSDDDDDNFDEMFWKMGTKSYKDFLSKLSIVTPKSLLMTKSVLDMRTKIQLTIQKLQEEITKGLNKLERLKDEVNIVLKHKSTIEQNKDFTYTVTEDVLKHEKIPSRSYITNCVKCNTTCHYPCTYSNNSDKIKCASMDKGKCVVCDGKCHWSDHVNNDFRIITERKTKTKDSMELKSRYQKAKGEFISAEVIVSGILNEIQVRQLKTVGLASEIRTHLEELDKIALKPNPLSTLNYIDILIDAEQTNAKPGWKERKIQLLDIRKEVVVMNSAIKRGEDPFEEYKKRIAEERKTKRGGLWETMGDYLENIGFFKMNIF